MKKWLFVILACLLGVSSSGCAVTQVFENKADNQKHAEKVSKKLICYINEKDVDGIEQLFNKFSQKEEKLREDIEDFLIILMVKSWIIILILEGKLVHG